MAEVIIDSNLNPQEAIGDEGPESIRKRQTVATVRYVSFDGLEHQGQLVINRELRLDVIDWFAMAFRLEFPIEKVIPASQFNFDDQELMAANVSSGFNYRNIAGTERVSKHATGRAFDINPRQNPYIRKVNDEVITEPAGAIWQPDQPGTLHGDHELVHFLEERGWEWGGRWSLDETGRVDYQHFEKS